MASTTSLVLARRVELDVAALSRDCDELSSDPALLNGPGSAVVRAAARRLVVTLELRAQDGRRLAAETLRPSEPRRTGETSLVRVRRFAGSTLDLNALARDCAELAANHTLIAGPGAAAVRAAARHVVLALELYEQDRRRLAAETLRFDAPSASLSGARALAQASAAAWPERDNDTGERPCPESN